jgi:hypothetical protein
MNSIELSPPGDGYSKYNQNDVNQFVASHLFNIKKEQI